MKLNRLFTAGFRGDLLALFAGALLTLAFAPFAISPLAIVAPALLLGLWLKVSPKRAFFRGFLFGLGLFCTGVYWVFTSIHTYGDASVLLSVIITAGFMLTLALFPALNGYLFTSCFPKNNAFKTLCAFPALWVLFEWARSWALTGFPWLFLGYSQVHTPLKGYAPLLSVYGVSLAVTLTSSLLVYAYSERRHRTKAYKSLIAIMIIWVIGGISSFIPWTKTTGAPVKVSLVQGNIPQSLKWTDEELQPTLDRYESMTAAHWDSQIIIWPEGAVPVPLQEAEEFIQKMSDAAKVHKDTVVIGIPIKAVEIKGYYNAIVATGTGQGVYLKRRLVPFGEFLPFKPLLTRLLDSLQIPMSDFIDGPHVPQAITAAGLKMLALVCYEVAYPELAMSRDADIGALLTVSNDGWFGRSIAQAQHLQISQMRAIEMRRPLLFVGNTGITAIINAYGNIQSQIAPFETLVLTDTVQARTGKTPWQMAAMDPILLICLFMILIALRMRKTN
ncbi:MAG: apolipoprotein N-acyltransferase [Gammaproteobacteria bacterium]|nr:apolipoprotein N-acyltransferase [Gammaproteobacteria bacterium]